MEKTLILFEKWCRANNWATERKKTDAVFPEIITQRYPMAEKCDYFHFYKYFDKCLSPDKQSWFLCEYDYSKEFSETEFGWNDMEMIGLAAAENDEDEYCIIQSWWNNYLPILLSVRDGYSHFSVSLHENSFGRIEEGYEPIFEDTTAAAGSLTEFLEKIMNNDIIFS